jgi:hypothetical protein
VPGAVDIIGYYGNSGDALSDIPKIADIHENYNVIIITFASFTSKGVFSLDIQGPYKDNLDALAADLKAWKAGSDKWGRQRLALVSVGGQNGRWPSSASAQAIESGLDDFMDKFGLDGLDIDLENMVFGIAGTVLPVIQKLVIRGKVVTAAPEAAQGPLNKYKDLLKYLSWVHPQFYNNPPNAVAAPWVPTDRKKWPTPWTVHGWQDESQGEAYWAAVLGQIGKVAEMKQHQLGMLFPSVARYNWNAGALVRHVKNAGVSHVGHWALAYDHQQGWKWAKALGALNGSPSVFV